MNYLLRALNVPAGKHSITFTVDPDSIRKGDAIATVCVILMYALILFLIAGTVVRRVRKNQHAGAPH